MEPSSALYLWFHNSMAVTGDLSVLCVVLVNFYSGSANPLRCHSVRIFIIRLKENRRDNLTFIAMNSTFESKKLPLFILE